MSLADVSSARGVLATVFPELPRDIYRYPGPFASVYVDVTRDHQNAPHEIELRFKDLAASLAEQGADDADIRAIEAVVSEPTGQPGPAGRAVIATEGRVRLSAVLPQRPRREIARWATLPHLMPLLAQQPDTVPHVVVSLGKTTATVRSVGASGSSWEVTEHGQEDDVHKARAGGTAHLGMQRRTEEIWKENLREFAETVEEAVAKIGAQLLVLAGDVQARAILLDELGGRSREIVAEVNGPSPDDETTDEDIDDQIRVLVAERAARETRSALDRFAGALGRDDGMAVTGMPPVVHAFQQAQVQTLFIQDDPSSDRELWIGPEPGQLATSEDDLRRIGAEPLGRDRADAALVRAAAVTNAWLVVVPHPHAGDDPQRAGSAAGAQGAGPDAAEVPEMTDGVGAVLRFATPNS